MSADIIKAVTGHTDLKQVSVYTAGANQAALAEMGLKAIAGKRKSEQILSNQSEKLDKRRANKMRNQSVKIGNGGQGDRCFVRLIQTQ